MPITEVFLARGFHVPAKFLHHGTVEAKRLACAGAVFGALELAVNVKDILPRAAMDRAGLDLGEVCAFLCQFRERGNESSNPIFDGERQA
jgi:hypothetical protein